MILVSVLSFIVFFTYFFLGGALFSQAIHRQQTALFYLTASFIFRAFLFLGPSLLIYNVPIKWSLWITGPIKVILLPLTFLFIEKLIKNENRIRINNLWHFLPFIIDCILTFYVALFHADEVIRRDPMQENIFGLTWEGNFFYTLVATTARAISLIQAIIYSVIMVPRLRKFNLSQKLELSLVNYRFYYWTKGIILLFILAGFFEGAALVGVYQYKLAFSIWILFLILNALYLFIYVYIFHPDKISPNQSASALPDAPRIKGQMKAVVPSGEWLRVFIERELFLNPELTLQKTSTELNIAKYKLSQLIKDEGHPNFYCFVNYYRIEKSKALLKELPDYHILESVIEDAGFKSRSTFFRVFKETTGVTPGIFWKESRQ